MIRNFASFSFLLLTQLIHPLNLKVDYSQSYIYLIQQSNSIIPKHE